LNDLFGGVGQVAGVELLKGPIKVAAEIDLTSWLRQRIN